MGSEGQQKKATTSKPVQGWKEYDKQKLCHMER